MKTKKTSQGRQKIAIAKIPKRNNLQVTFSKRRSGLFKKASELCTLCGVEVAIIVFSPANKPFSFGHPEVDSIVDRFLARNPNLVDHVLGSTGTSTPTINQQIVEARRSAGVHELNMEVTRIVNELEAEKKCGEAIDKTRKASEKQCWWERPIDELGFHDLQILASSLEELKKNVNKQANMILMESSAVATNYSSSVSPFFMLTQDGGHHRRFESKIKPIDDDYQNGPAYNFGYPGHGLF